MECLPHCHLAACTQMARPMAIHGVSTYVNEGGKARQAYVSFVSQTYPIGCDKTMSAHAVPCRALLRRAVPATALPNLAKDCGMLCRAVPYHAVLLHAVTCRALLCYAVLCRAVPCRAVLCCALLCYAVLWHAVPCPDVPGVKTKVTRSFHGVLVT